LREKSGALLIVTSSSQENRGCERFETELNQLSNWFCVLCTVQTHVKPSSSALDIPSVSYRYEGIMIPVAYDQRRLIRMGGTALGFLENAEQLAGGGCALDTEGKTCRSSDACDSLVSGTALLYPDYDHIKDNPLQ
jgi:hypothetical protein